LYYAATDRKLSGGLGCAACHPDGRDDGFTWHEATFVTEDGQTTNFVGSVDNIPPEAHTQGFARRTPLLAGRVNGDGPYGWHAESPTLDDRELKGFGLHRWGAVPEHDPEFSKTSAAALADFLRRGLRPPPSKPTLNEVEREGRALFSSPQTQCSECHPAQNGYTLGHVSAFKSLPPPAGFDVEPDIAYKVPSLRHLAGRAPYFHDGSAKDLESLVFENGDRMGRTTHLSPDQQRSLVAFLKTL
jgi:mono/diheme cytochrome c family protein